MGKDAATIARLNDAFRVVACRAVFGEISPDDVPGKLVVTKGVSAIPVPRLHAIFNAVKEFNDFTPDNDPYGEHDFGSVDNEGEKLFWKIDYYDKNLTYGSEDPADSDQTTRVMTVMYSHEY